MKKIVFILLIFITGGITNHTFAREKGREVVCFKSDMDCARCEKTLKEHLKFEKGDRDLKVNHASNTSYIEYKEGKNSDKKLAEAIKEKGYKAEKITSEEYKKLEEHVKHHGHEHGAEVHKKRE